MNLCNAKTGRSPHKSGFNQYQTNLLQITATNLLHNSTHAEIDTGPRVSTSSYFTTLNYNLAI